MQRCSANVVDGGFGGVVLGLHHVGHRRERAVFSLHFLLELEVLQVEARHHFLHVLGLVHEVLLGAARRGGAVVGAEVGGVAEGHVANEGRATALSSRAESTLATTDASGCAIHSSGHNSGTRNEGSSDASGVTELVGASSDATTQLGAEVGVGRTANAGGAVGVELDGARASSRIDGHRVLRREAAVWPLR